MRARFQRHDRSPKYAGEWEKSKALANYLLHSSTCEMGNDFSRTPPLIKSKLPLLKAIMGYTQLALNATKSHVSWNHQRKPLPNGNLPVMTSSFPLCTRNCLIGFQPVYYNESTLNIERLADSWRGFSLLYEYWPSWKNASQPKKLYCQCQHQSTARSFHKMINGGQPSPGREPVS